jgi:hypothetical protein
MGMKQGWAMMLFLIPFAFEGYSQNSPQDSSKFNYVISHPKTPHELLLGSWILEDVKYNTASENLKEEALNLLANSNRWVFYSDKLLMVDAEGTKKFLPCTFIQWQGIGSIKLTDEAKQLSLEIESISDNEMRLFFQDKTISLLFVKENFK